MSPLVNPELLAAEPGESWPVYAEDEMPAVGASLVRPSQSWTGRSSHSRKMRDGHWRASFPSPSQRSSPGAALRAFGFGAGDEVVVRPGPRCSASCVSL